MKVFLGEKIGVKAGEGRECGYLEIETDWGAVYQLVESVAGELYVKALPLGPMAGKDVGCDVQVKHGSRVVLVRGVAVDE